MRSVKSARARPQAGRGRTNRGNARQARATRAPKVFGRRKRNDSFSLFLAGVRSRLETSRPILWFTASLLVLTLLGGVVAGGYIGRSVRSGETAFDAALADAGFGIASIKLSGNRRTQAGDILAALGLDEGQSIFAADLEAARNRLLGLPWVFEAEVRRQFPGAITVNIIEREPFALWQTAGGLYVVERSGRVIAPAQGGQYPHLPLLSGEGAPAEAAALVDAVAQHRAIGARLKAMQRVSERRWNLLLAGEVVVELPEEGWGSQLDVLEHLIVDKGVLERDVAEIDLRSRDNYVFILRNGAKQQSTRGNSA
jgi:cell division protein FtsQ